MTIEAHAAGRPAGSVTPALERLSEEAGKYLAAKSVDLVDRGVKKVNSLVGQIQGGSGEAGVLATAGAAGAVRLAAGESMRRAVLAALMAGAKAKLQHMFGPNVSVGQKIVNVLKIILFVLLALVALLLIIIILPVAIVFLLIAGNRDT
jgi:hypothetical protein